MAANPAETDVFSSASAVITNYRLAEALAGDARHRLYRGWYGDDPAPVLLKMPATEPAGAADIALLRREHEILARLPAEVFDAGVARPLQFIAADGHCALLLEDRGDRPLAAVAALSLARSIDCAVDLLRILATLHRAGIVHRAVNPNSVLLHPADGRLRLTDFSAAACDATEASKPLLPAQYSALLPYAAPELTGRVNRSCDYRADFYAVGALLYELLTGRRPFTGADTLELIHQQIARMPPPPSEVSAAIPLPLSQIVMKLLAKPAEERYQSAACLERDLLRCRPGAANATVESFRIAVEDISDRFAVPQRLYGREAELAALNRAYEQVRQGQTALLLVAGYAGIGKTALLHELHVPVARSRGQMVSGKFDQLSRDLPYGALVEALRQLMQRVLTETPARLARSRERLQTMLGANAAVIAEVVPELELVIGAQKPAPRLPPAEAQNRFMLAFENFVAALATAESPLVIFLDDLQWIDSATLQLLRLLPASEQIRHFLLLGAYRDNEVDADHPLLRTVAALQADGADVQRITLRPLDAASLTQLAAETLHVSQVGARPLASLLQDKTSGNPFFVIQFLLAMHQEGLIRFDADHAQWRCQLDAIAAAPRTDNVVDLMSRKIDRLAPATRRLLALAAGVGNRFDAATLAAAGGKSVQATLDDLAEATAEKLIVAHADGSFEFLHDRVQQAAYALIAAGERPKVHLSIGRLLWQRHDDGCAEQPFDRIFDAASHLNLGAPLIDSPAERIALARLNLAAGRRAKASAAFQTGSGYFSAGVALLDHSHWQTDHALAFELNLEAAQGAYLCGEFTSARQRFEALLERAADDLERASVYRLRMIQFENVGRYDDALASAREGLALFGVVLPEGEHDKEAALERDVETIRQSVGERTIASLIDLPLMTDPAQTMVMRILTDIWSSAYITGDATLARLISATLVRLSLAHGNTAESAYGYVTHAITAGPVQEDYAAAWQWGCLALRVNEKFDDVRLRAKIYQQFHAHVNLWCRPFADCIEYAKQACRSGLESGDFLYAAYGAATESWPALASAQNLAQFVRDQEPNLALLARLKNASFADVLRLMLAWARALQGQTDAPLSLAGPDFDEDAYARRYGDNPFFSLFHAIARLHLCYVLDDYAGAQQAAASAHANAHRLTGMLWSVQYQFWSGLTAAALYGNFDGRQREGAREALCDAARSLAVLAASCPENFRCAALLLQAELARIGDSPIEAIDLYEQAIEAADQAAMPQQQALATELAARFWLACGNRRIAAVYLRSALQHYTALGAQAKTRRLVERHPELLTETPHAAPMLAQSTAARRDDALDIVTIGRAAQAIAANVELEALVGQMLKLAIENAAASSGVLVENRDGVLYLAAEGRADGTAIVLPRDRPLDAGRPHCSSAIVNYVSRTCSTLVLTDAAQDARFEQDEYIAALRPKSVLCLPILQQGRLEAIFYLENALVPDAFSAERIEVIRILAAQAAMSLKSGRLVQQMEHEVAERRRAEEQLRVIEAGMAAATGGDFFRALVRNVAQALQVRYAFVAECFGGGQAGASKRVRSRAFWSGDDFGDDFEYDAPGTPCQAVLDGEVCHHATDLQSLFPADVGLVGMGAVSYLGMPLTGSSGEVIGHLAILDTKPMAQPATALSVLRLSAGRAGAELERLKAEEGLQHALTEVERLKNRLQEENVYLRRELIANVSHDLRSPLASLRGYLDTLLIKEDSLEPTQRHAYLEIAVRQAEHLQGLISELFDLARLDFQGYAINTEAVHLGELARDVLQKFQLAADRHQVALQLETQGEVGFVLADIGLLERVLANLLENALAYTPPHGRIQLSLRALNGKLRIEVADTGCGIPAADLPHIFERFYRVDKSRTHDDRGSGLGLAIVKRIVELHGAEIHAESRPDAGTRFWFDLPPLRVGAALMPD